MSHHLVLNGAPGYQEKHRAAYNYEEQPVQRYGTAGQHVPSLAALRKAAYRHDGYDGQVGDEDQPAYP